MSTVTVSAIQAPLTWQDPDANHRYFANQMASLFNVDVVVLPEMFSTGFSMASDTIAEASNGPTLAWMKSQAARLDAAVTGSVAVRDGNHYFNRMFWVEPDGSVSYYDKRHLFRMAAEHHHYHAGQERVIVPWRGLRFCLQVCYDLRFPVFSRNRGDYDVLIYVANWPAARAHAWRSLLPARAIENQCYTIGLNRVGQDGNGHDYSGDSVVLNYLGQPLQSAPANAAVTLQCELDCAKLTAFRESFPAALDADDFEFIGSE